MCGSGNVVTIYQRQTLQPIRRWCWSRIGTIPCQYHRDGRASHQSLLQIRCCRRGGIINIILKKNQNLGFNGQINAATGSRDKYTGGINLNYGADKFDIYTSYNYQNRRRYRKSDESRITSLPNASPILDQDSYNEEVDISHLSRGGIDYHPTDKSTIGLYAQGNFGNEDAFEILNQRSMASGSQLDNLYIRDITEKGKSDNFETGINYTINLGWTYWLLNATVYHRYFTDVATRITRLTNDNVTIQTRGNADTRSSTGFELINQFTDWFDATLTGNFFYFQGRRWKYWNRLQQFQL